MNTQHIESKACEEDFSRGCPNGYVTEKTSRLTGEVVKLRLPCKTKGCSTCGPWLRQCHFAHAVRCLEAKPGLHFLTLGLEPSFFENVPPLRHWPGVLSHIRSTLFKRLRRRFELTYFWSCEWPPGKVPHYHYVVSAAPSSKSREAEQNGFLSVLEEQYDACGGGTSLLVDPIRTQTDLEGFVGYMYKEVFTNPNRAGRSWGVRRLTGASQGLGYRSEAQVRRRRRIARQQAEDPFVLQREAEAAHQSALERSVGKTVRLPDGRTGQLLRWSQVEAEIEIDGEVVVTDGHEPIPIEGKDLPVCEVGNEVDLAPMSGGTPQKPPSDEEEPSKEDRRKAVREWASRGCETDFGVRNLDPEGS
jgi:hypothetical protein